MVLRGSLADNSLSESVSYKPIIHKLAQARRIEVITQSVMLANTNIDL